MDPPPLLTIFGGVALLVFGVRYLRKGLDRLFGTKLGSWMQRLASTRPRSFLAGLTVSVLAPSSTTMSLLAVQTVRAGHLTARQMLSIMLGANIGLTVMVVLIALGFERFAPIILLFGVALFQFAKRNRIRGIGQVLLAVGFIFLAIEIMSQAAVDAREAWDASTTGAWSIINFQELQEHPFVLACCAAIMALALQSSTATIGLVIGLGTGLTGHADGIAGTATLRVAIPVVLGANVGLAITTVLVGWRHIEARRLALGNLLLKTGVTLVGLLIIAFAGGLIWEPGTPSGFALAIAGAHTGYNVIVAMVGLPLVEPLTRLMERLVPTPPPQPGAVLGPRYISATGPIGGVALAMGQSLREITHISEIIRSMLRDVWTAMKTNNEKLAREVAERDDRVDMLDAEVTRFLTRLAAEEAGDFDPDEQMKQLRYSAELETIGDIIDKNLCDLVLKKIRLRAEFSKEGAEELEDFYQKVSENVVIAETLFTIRDRDLAQQLLRHKERIDQYERDLRDRHFARLNAGLTEAHETSAIHLDLLTHLKRINSCVSHVAYATLQDSRATPAAGAGE